MDWTTVRGFVSGTSRVCWGKNEKWLCRICRYEICGLRYVGCALVSYRVCWMIEFTLKNTV